MQCEMREPDDIPNLPFEVSPTTNTVNTDCDSSKQEQMGERLFCSRAREKKHEGTGQAYAALTICPAAL